MLGAKYAAVIAATTRREALAGTTAPIPTISG